jgi:acetate kinase
LNTKLLVINCGSSTLKFELFESSKGMATIKGLERLAVGFVDKIGGIADIELRMKGQHLQKNLEVLDHSKASKIAIDLLVSNGLLKVGELTGIGHRVVHGGARFTEPVIINEDVIGDIEEVSQLAPLHNQPSLEAIYATRQLVGTEVPMVAVFDSAFHKNLPESAYRYAIPVELADRLKIRRYGFHGTAHRYMLERYCDITANPASNVNIITLQLGNGCSAAAIKNGVSVDTSMGMTPLEGLMMGTRSGDVDPTLASFIARHEKVSIQTAEDLLNIKSGLLGISSRSGDMRELLLAEADGDRRAVLAIDMFCYRVRKYIGAYAAVLGRIDAVVFGGGIGENAAEVRSRICSGLELLGIRLDQERNEMVQGKEGIISADASNTKVYVIPVDEAITIAHDTLNLITNKEQHDE